MFTSHRLYREELSPLKPNFELLISGLSLATPSVGVGVYTQRLITGLMHQAPDFNFGLLLPDDLDSPAGLAKENIILLPKAPKLGNDYANGIASALRLGIFLRDEYPKTLFHATNPIYSPILPERWIVTFHDLIPRRFTRYFGKTPVRRIMQFLVERSAFSAEAILGVSECTALDLQSLAGFPQQKIHILHNWVGEEFIKFTRSTANSLLCAIREKYHLPENYWLYLGGYDYRKNIEFLIRAYASAKRRHQGKLPPLVLAGNIPTDLRKPYCDVHGALRDTELTLEDVVMPGRIASEDLPALYGSASLLIYPSLYEGFGYPAAEAMAVGIPVLVSDTSSLPEVVRRPECRFDPINENQLAGKLLEAAENPEKFLCQLPSEFTEKVAIGRYLEIIRALASQAA